jgi:hypothetical protein
MGTTGLTTGTVGTGTTYYEGEEYGQKKSFGQKIKDKVGGLLHHNKGATTGTNIAGEKTVHTHEEKDVYKHI